MTRVALNIRFALIFTLLLLLPSLALAQFGASVEGTVTDKSGAVVAGASVTVTNQATGVSSSTATTDAGFYRVAALPPGRYKVLVSAPSFKQSTTADLAVEAEATRGLNVILTPGGAQESVTVSAEGTALQTEDASVTGSIGAQQVQELPTFGRDPYELLRLAPGVFGDGARGSDARATFLPNTV